MRLTRVAGPLLILLLAGCGARQAPAGQSADDQPLRGQTFDATSVTEGGKPYALVAGTRVSLAFTDDGRLAASAGCNTMSGAVRTDGDRLDIADLAVTDMGCDPPRHEQDEWLAGVLGDGPVWRQQDGTLTITAGDTELVLERREDRPLAGEWTVDTVLDGQTASSTPAGASIAFADGRAEVNTGCNTGAADYTLAGDTIRFTHPVVTRKACPPDIMRLERAMLAVLDGEAGYAIDGDRLTLTTPSGEGLQLRAE
jgi:heat shock protein HslJ